MYFESNACLLQPPLPILGRIAYRGIVPPTKLISHSFSAYVLFHSIESSNISGVVISNLPWPWIEPIYLSIQSRNQVNSSKDCITKTADMDSRNVLQYFGHKLWSTDLLSSSPISSNLIFLEFSLSSKSRKLRRLPEIDNTPIWYPHVVLYVYFI